MPTAPDPITSPPDVPGQPYDATRPDGDDCAGWKKGNSGPADPGTFEAQGDWPDGPPPWKQT